MSLEELHRAVLELTGQQPDMSGCRPRWKDDLLVRLSSRRTIVPGPMADAPARQSAIKGLGGPEAFGIEPTPLAAVGYEWLGRFHRSGKFAGRRINLTATS